MRGVRLVGLVLALMLGVLMGAAGPAAGAGLPGHPEWWFDTWNVPALWSGGARGQGITIGEIDTGVTASLPELSGNVLAGMDFGPPGGDGRTDRDGQGFGHGTAMADLMVGQPNPDGIEGLAPGAKLLPIAVPLEGTTDQDTPDNTAADLLKGIRWAADQGAKVISMSLGAADDPDTPRSCPADEQEAVDYALSKGALVVASGGNSGDKGSPVEEPSVCLGVVSVGAVDQGGAVPVWSSKHPYLTVTAPGVNIPSLGNVPGVEFYGDGTSQAGAITSAGLALIWSRYPQLTNRQVLARLLATLDGRHQTRDSAYGYGTINIGAAINNTVPADAPDPVFDAVDPFLAKDKAVAALNAQPATPADAGPKAAGPKAGSAARAALPGRFSVQAASGPLTGGAGLAGLVAAAVGLVGVVVLVVPALRRRRQLRSRLRGQQTSFGVGSVGGGDSGP